MGNSANHCGCHTIDANGDEHDNDGENDENQGLTVAERIEKIELPDKKASTTIEKIEKIELPNKKVSTTPDKSDPKGKSTPVCEIERKHTIAGLILAVLFLSLIVVIVYLAIKLASKNDNCKLNKLNHEELLRGPENDPFFGTAFPKKGSRVNIKCFLPFKGDYTIDTIFEGENKGSNVTKICPGGNETHHYNLYCDSDHNTGCNPSKCSVECNKFRISLSKMHMVLIDLDDSCLSLNGRFAIWNSTMINSQETSAHT